MTNKALNFIVSGMLATEHDVATERMAFILSRLADNVIDGFTDGFVREVHLYDTDELFKYVCERNKGKILTEYVDYQTERDGFDLKLKVTVKRTVYAKPDGKSWEKRDQKDDVYTEKVEEQYTDIIYLNHDSDIPGIEIKSY